MMSNAPSYIGARLRADARAIFAAGLAAAAPGPAVKRHCRREGNRLIIGGRAHDLSAIHRLIVIGAGKAAPAMAAALEEICGDRIDQGLVITKYGHAAPPDTARPNTNPPDTIHRDKIQPDNIRPNEIRPDKIQPDKIQPDKIRPDKIRPDKIRPDKIRPDKIRIAEAGHPLPDENGQKAATALLEMVRPAGERDLVICLLSGGGSALMPAPWPGLTLAHKREVTDVLLAAGATIHEINALRKHLSAIKGGRLAAAAYPAALECLILSDVVGDDLDVIASGPCVADASRFSDCLRIIDAYAIRGRLPEAVMRHLADGAAGGAPETPKAADPRLARSHPLIVAANDTCLSAARAEAARRGYHVCLLTARLEGEARQVARVLAAIGRQILATGDPAPPPACVLSGGETTVTLRGTGKGGRNQELALAAARHLRGAGPALLLSAGTDGTDGPTEAAGAMADADTWDRALAMGLDPDRHLMDNDSFPLFQALDDLLITGPTGTNVMDIQVLLAATPDAPGTRQPQTQKQEDS